MVFLGLFCGSPISNAKFLAKIGPQELEYYLLAYFCMGNPKKLVEMNCPPSRFQLMRFFLTTTLKGISEVNFAVFKYVIQIRSEQGLFKGIRFERKKQLIIRF